MIKIISNCLIINGSGQLERCDIHISKGEIKRLDRSMFAVSRPGQAHEKIDAEGRIVLPGFVDCHCHLFSLAESFEEVNLIGASSIKEMQERIRAFSEGRRSKVKWILGRGWDQEKLSERRFPSRHDLDAASPDSNVIMTRICGHVAVLNSRAIEFFTARGALGKDAPDALVPRETPGAPSGIVKESELTKCWSLLPKQRSGDLERLFLRAQEEALRFGLTGVHCILDNLDQLHAIRKLDRLGKVMLKLSLFIPIGSLPEIESMTRLERMSLFHGKRFRVLGFKAFADGSLGARTAALTEDYSDEPGNKGVLYYSDREMKDYAKRVKKLGLVLATHAIGDRAVEQTLRAYEDAGIVRADGFRIEHCSILTPALLNRLSRVVVCVQPSFATSDYWLRERIGNKRSLRFGYGFRSLSRVTLVVGSSDAPVESLSPLDGIASAISNHADQTESLSINEAIKLYTVARAGISPVTNGSGLMQEGSACDVVMLESSRISDIPTSRVIRTFIDGVEMKPRRRKATLLPNNFS